jgi:NAD(P)-dependent dehydrogenase (short-subunit alcohol dehydrogenase family)
MPPAVLITGAGRRIGAVLARAFGDAGWHVVIHYGASRDEAESLASELPSAECVGCDLADGDAAEAMVTKLAERLDDWRVLINCAAVFKVDAFESFDSEIFDEAMAVNAVTPVRLTRAFLASARSRGGKRIVNFLDMKLLNPNPDFFSYTMSKQALAGAVTMMAMAAPAGEDRIYGLAPGAIMASHDQDPEEHEISGRMNLLRRITAPGELADAALFLAEGWLASGETLFVDSGQHLLSQPRDVLYLARQ